MKNKHREKLDEGKVKLISFISFLLGFSQSLLAYVMSSYFKDASGTENVGAFYFLAHVVVLVGLLNMHSFIKKLGKARAFLLFFFAQIAMVALLTSVAPSWLGIGLLILYIIAADLVFVVLDIILEEYSEDSCSGRIRGLHLMVINAGFLLGPLISTRILDKFGFGGLFFVVMLLNMVVFVAGMVGLSKAGKKFTQKLTVRDLFGKILVNPDMMRIYAVAFALEFFFALMVVYTPLYLLDLGYGWEKIGIIFTAMLVPFVVLQYPAGVVADKWLGEKELIIGGLLLMALTTAGIYFMGLSTLGGWALLLLGTRVGAAVVEALRDSYFYKKIDARDVDFIAFFRTARPVAYVCATALSALVLLVFPLKAMFLFVAAVVALSLIPALGMRDSSSERERALAAVSAKDSL